MNEFNDTDRRQGGLLVASGINSVLKKRLDGVAAALGAIATLESRISPTQGG